MDDKKIQNISIALNIILVFSTIFFGYLAYRSDTEKTLLQEAQQMPIVYTTDPNPLIPSNKNINYFVNIYNPTDYKMIITTPQLFVPPDFSRKPPQETAYVGIPPPEGVNRQETTQPVKTIEINPKQNYLANFIFVSPTVNEIKQYELLIKFKSINSNKDVEQKLTITVLPQ